MQDMANLELWALGLFLIVLAALVSHRFGNHVWWKIWKAIAKRAGLPTGTRSKLAREIGSWERIIYIFGAAHGHYDLIGGWLLMKAFFSWIPNQTGGFKPTSERERSVVMDHYNGFLIGNLISLFIGISLGLIAKFLFLWIRIHCAL